MSKHAVALDLLRTNYNALGKNTDYVTGRRVWLMRNIDYDKGLGRTPDKKHVKELDELTVQMRLQVADLESLQVSIVVLEADEKR